MSFPSFFSGFSQAKQEHQTSYRVQKGGKHLAGLLRNKEKTRKKIRRIKGKRKEAMLNIFSTNAAGLKAKVESCKYEIKDTNAEIFTIQETHFEKKGKFCVEGFEVFDSIRKNKKDGGTIIGVHNALQPVLIQEYSEQFELIVVEVNISGRELRIISGYDPQESWPEEERLPFFLALEEEINKAEMLGKSIVIQMDANSKLGTEFIENDPHVQSPNGHILSEIIIRHGLIVGNGLKTKCTGLITRKRVTKEATEESVIDFVIVSIDI